MRFRLSNGTKETEPDMLASTVRSAMNAGGGRARESPSSGRWSNLDFLGKGKARSAWADSWPEDGYDFSWDAVGRVQIGKVGWEWLLVTAFAEPDSS